MTTLVIATVVVGLVVLVVLRRVRAGEWEVPDRSDVVWVKNQLAPHHAPPKVLYVHRHGLTVTPGEFDDAHRNRSAIVKSGANKSVDVPRFRGSVRAWRSIMKCVKTQFAPFDITVTDVRPKTPDYIMAVVGGRAKNIGVKSYHTSGLAPFNGKVVHNAVVFVFSRTLRAHPRKVCETLAMEVAHAYGLDHGYLCKDVMTYLTGCGAKRFVDKDVPCGEHKRRTCKNGKPTQNSYRHMMSLLGPRRSQPE